jgi:hypothetical protein
VSRQLVRAAAAAAALLLVILATGPAGATGAAARALPTAEDSGRRFTLLEQPAWVTLGQDVPLRVAITGPLAGLQMRVTVHASMTSRTAFERSVDGDRLGSDIGDADASPDALPISPAGGRIFTLRLQDPNLPRDTSRLRLPMPNGGRTGVFPLEVELVNPESGEQVAGFVTQLVAVAPAVDGEPLGEQLNLSWIWPIAADPATRPDGKLRAGFLDAIGPDGRLNRLAEAAARSGGVPLTIVPGPETLEAWTVRGKADPVANSGVLALRSAARTQQVLSSPYVRIDMPSLESVALGEEATLQLNHGAVVLGDLLNTKLDPRTTTEAPLDPPTLARLQRGGVDRLVVSPGALEPLESPPQFTPARPFTLENAGTQLAAYQTDDGLTDLLTDGGPPALRAANFLAGLAIVAIEQPNQTRGLAIRMPPRWDPEPALLDAVLTGLDGNPLVAPVTLDELFDKVPLEQQRRSAPVVRELASIDPADPTVNPDRFRTTRDHLSAYKSTVPANDPLVIAGDRGLLISLTSAWPGALGRRLSAARLEAIDTAITGFSNLIETPPSGLTVTLTSRQADLPLSFNNRTGKPIRVQIRLESAKLRFPSGGAPEGAICSQASSAVTCTLDLPPRNKTVRFPVETRASGTFPLRMTVTSEDGQLPLGSARYTVRSTVVSGVGVFLTIGAGLFLAIWWITHWRRSRRQPIRPATLAT